MRFQDAVGVSSLLGKHPLRHQHRFGLATYFSNVIQVVIFFVHCVQCHIKGDKLAQLLYLIQNTFSFYCVRV
jgi:hypothetical protein